MKTFYFILLLLLAYSSNNVYAEGTKQVSSDSTKLVGLTLFPFPYKMGAYLTADTSQRLKVRITSTSERIHYGFRFANSGSTTLLTNMFIIIRDPSGSVVSGPTALPTSGAGLIKSAREAFVGPNIGTTTTGYNPLTFVPASTGEFSISLYRSSDGGVTEDTSTWSVSPYFDITVSNTAGTTIYPGRLFTRKWGLVALNSSLVPSGAANATPFFYVYSEDRTLTKISFMSGFRPVAFSIAMTTYGIENTSNWLSDRNSVNAATAPPSFAGGYRTFLQNVDTTLYPIRSVPLPPRFANPPFMGCAAPYILRFILHSAGDARILLDLNGISGFQVGTSDRMLEVPDADSGLNTFTWDGLNGLGSPVASGSAISLSVIYQSGRFNIPLHDAEINKGGILVDAIAPINSPNIRLYWNDANITPFGTCPGSLINATDSGINNALIGAVSPTHAWSGSGNPTQTIPAPFDGATTDQCDDFGNVRIINSWGWNLQIGGDSSSIFFGCYTLSGSVFHDANGLKDNIVNSTSSPSVPIPTGLYAHLVGDNGTTVIQTVAVDSSGNYSFPNVTSGTYRVVLNTSSTASLTPSVPSAWVNTGEHLGAGAGSDSAVNGYLNSIVVTNANVTNANFGIQKLPSPIDTTTTPQVNPGGTTSVDISSTFRGTDSGGIIDSIHITAFPTNVTSITIGGTTYTSSTWPTGGVTFVKGTSVKIDPIDGAVTAVIPFKVIDNAGFSSATTSNVNVPFIVVLPVDLLEFTAQKMVSTTSTLISWKTGVEKTGIQYQLEHSTNAQNWTMLNSVNANPAHNNNYSYVHSKVSNGMNYYRLKIVDLNEGATYSPLRTLVFDNINHYSIIVYPNPLTESFTISTSDGSPMSQVILCSKEGKKIQELNQVNSGTVINMNNYPSGFYLIKIKDKNGTMQMMKITKN